MRLLALLLFLFTSYQLQAATSVWKISNGQHTLYLGGTVHYLSKADYPLPAAFDQAYRAADQLVLETDIRGLNQVEVQQKMLALLSYPAGETLDQKLSEDVLAQVAEYASKRGLPVGPLMRFKPGLFVVTATALELALHDLADTGVDEHYMQKAIEDSKAIGQLETVDEQIGFIADMGNGQENELIRYTLDDLEALPSLMQKMVGSWRTGDLERLHQLAIAPYENQFPALFEDLVYQRNAKWVPHLQQLLTTPEVELVLVGVLHMVGDKGLVKLLEASGYQVEKLD